MLWRGTFRFWLSVLAADRDTRRGVRNLLISHDDTYRAVDQAAIRYDGGIHVKHRLTGYHDFFVERVNAGDRVLDIGSGKGELAYDLVATAGATVVGVDHDPNHLAFARQRFSHPNLQFLEADVLESIPEGHFDVIVLSNVLEHLHGRPEFLRGVVRSATPDRLLFRVPVYERDWTVPLRDEVGLLGYWDSDHKIEYVPDTFIAELAGAGLEVSELFLRWGEVWSVARPAVQLRAVGDLEKQPISALSECRLAATALQKATWQTVHMARDEGHTWTEIGDALGITRQSAWQRFSGDMRHPTGEEERKDTEESMRPRPS